MVHRCRKIYFCKRDSIHRRSASFTLYRITNNPANVTCTFCSDTQIRVCAHTSKLLRQNCTLINFCTSNHTVKWRRVQYLQFADTTRGLFLGQYRRVFVFKRKPSFVLCTNSSRVVVHFSYESKSKTERIVYASCRPAIARWRKYTLGNGHGLWDSSEILSRTLT